MVDEKAVLLIGSRASEFLSVRPIRHAHPDSDDYWDGNWLEAEIELAAGAFRGSFRACLRTDEFIPFRDQVSALYENLNGESTFDSMESWLTIQIKGDGLGHFIVECQANDNSGGGNSLNFSLSIDQTQLPMLVSGLDKIVEQFPLKGKQ